MNSMSFTKTDIYMRESTKFVRGLSFNTSIGKCFDKKNEKKLQNVIPSRSWC